MSRGAHDEWNIFRVLNERRRADGKLGAPNQIPVLFDGRGVPPSEHETLGFRRLHRQVRAVTLPVAHP